MDRLRLPLVAIAAANLAFTMLPSRTIAPATTRTGAVRPATPMLEARSGHTSTLLPDGRVLVAGGMRRNQDFHRSAELYDPVLGKFQWTGDMSVARVGHAAVLLQSGKVFIVGGWIGPGCTDSAELYDPSTGKFAAIGKMTNKRGQPSATLLPNGDVLIAGGADHESPGGIASAEVFHSATLKFERVAPMHHPRISHTATLLKDGRVLIAGGRGESVTAAAELYDAQTKQFTETGNMLTARYKHTAGLLPDGRVLIAGGSDEHDWKGTLKSAEIYDPRTATFIATSSMAAARFKLPAEAIQLASGGLLIAGRSKDTEIFDPNTQRFDAVSGRLSNDWHFMTETRLKDGSVLLAGGYANDDQGSSQTWIYRR
jgi:hypothetical protein